MTQITDYPTILNPQEADVLFPHDEDCNVLPADESAYALVATTIQEQLGCMANLPITIQTQSMDDPLTRVEIEGYDDCQVCAIATDAAGRQVRFIVWC